VLGKACFWEHSRGRSCSIRLSIVKTQPQNSAPLTTLKPEAMVSPEREARRMDGIEPGPAPPRKMLVRVTLSLTSTYADLAKNSQKTPILFLSGGPLLQLFMWH
jgi:hypothetical protein